MNEYGGRSHAPPATFRANGSERAAYHSIVGAGANGTILHYIANNAEMQGNQLLLIDAGCEYGYFASDVTRTFPVGGKFTKEQEAIYEIVLESQMEGIRLTRAGSTVDGIHKACVEVITRGLVRLGLLQGEIEKLIETEAYKPFYMLSTSHWLGMDVHDVGRYYVDGKPRPLAPGMVITVELGDLHQPGLRQGGGRRRGSASGSRTTSPVTGGILMNLTEGSRRR